MKGMLLGFLTRLWNKRKRRYIGTKPRIAAPIGYPMITKIDCLSIANDIAEAVAKAITPSKSIWTTEPVTGIANNGAMRTAAARARTETQYRPQRDPFDSFFIVIAPWLKVSLLLSV
jgi:hypothetical protein